MDRHLREAELGHHEVTGVDLARRKEQEIRKKFGKTQARYSVSEDLDRANSTSIEKISEGASQEGDADRKILSAEINAKNSNFPFSDKNSTNPHQNLVGQGVYILNQMTLRLHAKGRCGAVEVFRKTSLSTEK